MKKRFESGFTVLEFLIVLGIILILIAILLPNLQKSREKSADEKKITDLKTVALGVEQFKQVCGVYPGQIIAGEQCVALGTTNLGDLIPDINSYHFNDGQSGFFYVPLAHNPSNSSQCDGFHLGVQLSTETSGQLGVGDSNKDTPEGEICSMNVNGVPISGSSDTHIFDIYR